MALEREQLVNDAAARSRPIEFITQNGFRIVRTDEVDGARPAISEYTFLVRDPNEYELDITVRIDPSLVLEVFWRSEGRISTDSSYWISCAERHLAEYLFTEDDYPPDARISVNQLSPDDCDLAIRWGVDGNPLRKES